jgi:5'-deoxynucleotidase YfbR-like HD superfamily hydrolase
MADAGIVRNRLKIEATIDNARALLKLNEHTSLAAFLWDQVDGRPQINAHRSFKGVPAQTARSTAISKALKARGFRFVGPTTVYAFMQATGMVNDHLVSWQRMLSGRRLDLLNPAATDIEIEDIAHGLARVARWNGQTVGEHAFSVAQHALLVEEIATCMHPDLTRRWRLAALLHDAPEYVIGDLISPFKAALGLDYKAFEHKLLEAIHRRFGLPPLLPDRIANAIKAADRIAAYYEATGLAGFTLAEANRYFGVPRGVPEVLRGRLETIAAKPIAFAQKEFLLRFQDLSRD